MADSDTSTGQFILDFLYHALQKINQHLLALLPAPTDAQDAVVHTQICVLQPLQQRLLFALSLSPLVLYHVFELVYLLRELPVYLLQDLLGHDALRLSQQPCTSTSCCRSSTSGSRVIISFTTNAHSPCCLALWLLIYTRHPSKLPCSLRSSSFRSWLTPCVP